MHPGLLVAIACAILGFGAISRRAERSVLTPPMFFVLAGLLVGPSGLGLLSVDALDRSVLHFLAEMTLVVVLFTDASRIDLRLLRREGQLPVRLLGIGLPLTVVAGALAAWLVIPGIGPWEAALLAAVLTPTDAALGQAVVSNALVPRRIRQTLNVESGLNDGLALPIVLVFASLCSADGARGAGEWLRFVLITGTVGPLVGWCVGWAGGRLLAAGVQRRFVNAPFQRLSSLGLALLAYSLAELLHGNGFLAAFVAGLGLGTAGRKICDTLYEFGETEGQLLALFVFGIFGAFLVPGALENASVVTVGVALLSLTLVRMVPVAVSLFGTGLRPASVAFLAWFGPRGLASILFALLVVERGGVPQSDLLEQVTVLTVLLSTFLHGASAYPLARWYGRIAHGRPESVEHRESSEHRVRVRHVPHENEAAG